VFKSISPGVIRGLSAPAAAIIVEVIGSFSVSCAAAGAVKVIAKTSANRHMEVVDGTDLSFMIITSIYFEINF